MMAWTVATLQKSLKERKIKSIDLMRTVFAAIESRQPQVNAFISLNKAQAIEEAEKADRDLDKGNAKLLTGIPIGIKDVICTEGMTTTCGSKILHNFVPPYDATVITRLKAAGAIIVGKLNMDEFAMGSSNENSAYGPCRNPWDLTRVPGGSSGGSAAAVADRQVPLALGSDTGGSIRQPAAFCGITGLKPTYGRISRYGLVAFASSLDQIGPMALTVEDLAIVLQVMAGKDPLDATSSPEPVADYRAACREEVKGLTIGMPREYFGEGLSPEIDKAVRDAAALFEKKGAKVVEVSLPHTKFGIPAYYLAATAEASANLARYDGVKYGLRVGRVDDRGVALRSMYERTRHDGFGSEVKRRIMLGTFALSSGYYEAYYAKATKVRAIIRKDFEDAFKKCNLILTPVTPTVAFSLGSKMEDPLEMYLSDVYTITLNLAELPGLSLPAGFSSNGLPIGMQLIAPHFREDLLLRGGFSYQQWTDWHLRAPSGSSALEARYESTKGK
ncbi:MAG: Asp-tRNA(Asn)/Glu-tRNA(Gln) amidotransferase subunit GatA [Deltaproteobacteria bacterium]|nr:Asp-tRNA(Asn)/Glu-tRNA(Gln) amidotransferase subunit GatA [Deltaproteobacteria bacterium]